MQSTQVARRVLSRPPSAFGITCSADVETAVSGESQITHESVTAMIFHQEFGKPNIIFYSYSISYKKYTMASCKGLRMGSSRIQETAQHMDRHLVIRLYIYILLHVVPFAEER